MFDFLVFEKMKVRRDKVECLLFTQIYDRTQTSVLVQFSVDME
jgi:hypothetical protein